MRFRDIKHQKACILNIELQTLQKQMIFDQIFLKKNVSCRLFYPNVN